MESQKDKESFEVWFGLLGETHLERVIKLNRGASQEAWMAALSYRDKQIELSQKGACPTCEPIGELNLQLSNELSEIKSKLSGIISGE